MHIVAHRGYSGKYPESSPLAFDKALALPIHGVECDVHLSRDRKIVINHDATLDRTSDRSGKISQLEWSEIRKADIGGNDFPGQHPLLLDELLDKVIATGKHHIYIEIKHDNGHGDDLEDQVVQRLRYKDLLSSEFVHIISFSHRSMRRVARLAPELDRIYLRREWERYFNRTDFIFSKPTALGMSLLRGKIQPSAIGAHGLPTYMWTLDKEEDIKWAWANGVDTIATNEPEVALRAIEY